MNEVEFTDNVFGLRECYTIRNTKEAVEVESDKKYFQGRSVVEAFLRSCIDMDTWKHSWHMDTGDFTYNAETKTKIKKILQGKIEGRQEEIKTLEFAMKIIGRKKIKQAPKTSKTKG